MTQLNDLKRLEKESQHLYDNAHDDMSDYFKDVLELIFTHERLMQSHEQLQAKLDKACAALEFYAGSKDGKWISHVCDSYSGLNYAFDWNGDTQDEPHEVAVKAIAEIRKKDDNG